MKMREQIKIHESAAIMLICARCKIPVEAGDSHQCQEARNESDEMRQDSQEEKPN